MTGPAQFIFKWSKAFLICWALVMLSTVGWMPVWDKEEAPVTDSVERLKQTVRVLADDIGLRDFHNIDNLNKAADYVADSFQQAGYRVEEMLYEVNGERFRNIMAYQGAALPRNAVLIGAHYDSCNNPGANDNASGVAGLLEVARSLKDKNIPVVFLAFTNEEPPFFTTSMMGSYVAARHFKEEGIEFKAVVILEMIGYYSDRLFSQRYLPPLGPFYPNQANFVAVVGNFPSHKTVSALTAAFKRGSSFPVRSLVAPESIPGIYFSDHWSFWQFGYPAVMVTDTAFLRYPHYHLRSDRPEHLNFEKMARVIQGVTSGVMELAK
jgi:hypothetical protein